LLLLQRFGMSATSAAIYIHPYAVRARVLGEQRFGIKVPGHDSIEI
jgi:hypothetical protein